MSTPSRDHARTGVPELDLLAAVSIAGPAVDRWVLDRLREKGFGALRPAHGFVVQRLVAGPQPIGELAAELGVSQQAVSKSVAELVAAGYVERTTDGGDARRRPLRLTRRGRAMVAASRAARGDLVARVEAATGAEEYGTARRVLATVITELGLAEVVSRRAVPPS